MIRRGTILLALLGLVGCSGAVEATTTTSTTIIAETTTTFLNPFLDVAEEPSNFAPGSSISVVGLPADDPAWAGSFPSRDVEFFGSLWEFDRLDPGLTAVGEAANYQDGPVWERVEKEGKEPGYFPQDQTGVLGPVEDTTSDVSGLTGASADELLDLVADTVGETEGLEVVQITNREFGGREVYYDLIGGDDPVARGQRLRVVVIEAGTAFTVAIVERWPICVSSVTDAGTCG